VFSMHGLNGLWLAFVALFAASALAEAAALRTSAFLTNGTRGEGTVDTYGRDFEKVSVFAYHITEEGDVLPPDPWIPSILDQLMLDPVGRVILVTVNNRVLGPDGRLTPEHGGDTVKVILSDPQKRSEHIRQLVALADKAHGIELNYERFTPDMRDMFTAFLRDLHAQMPAGKKLSLVLQPKTDNQPGANGRGVDWAAVEPYVDYMRIMAYYYSWSTSAHGPVVPLETLRRLADFALRDPLERIPRHKVSIILSQWGWDWPMPVGNPGYLIEYAHAMQIAQSRAIIPLRDPNEFSLNFTYTADDGKQREVWIDDFTSTRARVELLQARGMPRVDIWNFNTGDSGLWDYLATQTATSSMAGLNFANDRRSDIAVFRPGGGRWLIDASHSGGTDLAVNYGRRGDVPVPGDYNGDGALDLAVYRPSYAGWWVDTNLNGGTDIRAVFGKAGDIPVPADYDGDGAVDFAVYDPSNASWSIDHDHDGKADLTTVYGVVGDVPVPGDYNGDGKADIAVFRPHTGSWYIDSDRNGGSDLVMTYGRNGDLPVPDDYDGDGFTDFAVYRPSWGAWFVDTDRGGGTDMQVALGTDGDIPVPANFDGDGILDLAVFSPGNSRWRADTNHRGDAELDIVFGTHGDIPLRKNGWILDSLGLTQQ
jgi:spore germination protein YaaH